MVVVADPHAHDQRIVKADEPSIPIVLRRSGLACRETLQSCGVAGALLNDALQQADQFTLILPKTVLAHIGMADLSGFKHITRGLACQWRLKAGAFAYASLACASAFPTRSQLMRNADRPLGTPIVANASTVFSRPAPAIKRSVRSSRAFGPSNMPPWIRPRFKRSVSEPANP